MNLEIRHTRTSLFTPASGVISSPDGEIDVRFKNFWLRGVVLNDAAKRLIARVVRKSLLHGIYGIETLDGNSATVHRQVWGINPVSVSAASLAGHSTTLSVACDETGWRVYGEADILSEIRYHSGPRVETLQSNFSALARGEFSPLAIARDADVVVHSEELLSFLLALNLLLLRFDREDSAA
ncbi:hypothetical protein KQI84_00170 [bacterium]|nr:hypothetical protein [bacterium]